MKKIFTLLTINSILLFSCSNPESSKEATTTDSINAEMPAAAVQPSASADSTVGTAGAAMPVQPQATVAAAPAGMNPAHGQPGHRCDIAVGAPLNSPAGAQPAATTQAATSISTTPQVAPVVQSTSGAMPADAKVATAPGMNPPHGEPGHDCAIKVGEPLKKN